MGGIAFIIVKSMESDPIDLAFIIVKSMESDPIDPLIPTPLIPYNGWDNVLFSTL